MRKHLKDGNVFLRFYLFILESGREGEREGEKHWCVVASCVPPAGDLAYNPGVCPDRELNQKPFGLQASTQATEPHQPGQEWVLKGIKVYVGKWDNDDDNDIIIINF